jgi:hypothetical protein
VRIGIIFASVDLVSIGDWLRQYHQGTCPMYLISSQVTRQRQGDVAPDAFLMPCFGDMEEMRLEHGAEVCGEVGDTEDTGKVRWEFAGGAAISICCKLDKKASLPATVIL